MEIQPDDSEDSTAAAGPTATIWKEYPVGFTGENAQMMVRTLTPFGIGIAFTFVLILVIGIAHEQGVFFDIALNLGMRYPDWEPIKMVLESMLRTALLPVLVLAYVSVLAICAAWALRDATISKALVHAARNAASRRAVPSPTQVESVIKKQFTGLSIFTITSAGTALIGGIVGLSVAISGGHPEAVLPSWIVIGVGIAQGAAAWLLEITAHKEHRRRRLIICEYWTTEDEQRAWDAAHTAQNNAAKELTDSARIERNPAVTRGARIVRLAGAAFMLAINLMYAVLFIMYPNATRFDAGEQVIYPASIQSVLNICLLVVAVVTVISIVLMVIGHVIEGRGRQAERAALREAASDPGSFIVSEALLDDYAVRRTVQVAGVLAALAGALLVAGPTTLLLSMTDYEVFSGASSTFARFSPTAIICTVLGVILIIIAGFWNARTAQKNADLRNLLMARWPRLPKITTERASDSGAKRRKIPARVGPALTPGTEQDDIIVGSPDQL